MSGDVQVRFCESLRVRLLRATRLLILCKTKRQLQRCKQRLIDILQAKRLRLSRKKTRIGSIDQGFHFLGIHYLGTQPLDKTNVTQEHSGPVQRLKSANSLPIVRGGGDKYDGYWPGYAFATTMYRSACANVTSCTRTN